jgi:hypothetical protein
MTKRSVINILGYAGLIPFVITALLVSTNFTIPGLDAVLVFALYSALIASFLGGALWGRALGRPTQSSTVVALLFSNAIVLLAFAAMFWLAIIPLVAVVLLAVSHLLLIWLERGVFAELFTEAESFYASFRLSLTTLVLLCHGLVLFSLATG